ncbi:MAG: PIN domain nuclease [Nitrospirota bacterium]
MFLIDSSAWIEYLRPQGSRKVKDRVREVLEKDEAVTCGIVVVEIPRGAKDDKTFKTLKETLMSLPQIPLNNEVIEKAAQWGYSLDRKGKTVSTTDLFIAAAASGKAVVLHVDSDFETIASLGLRQEKIELS